jgi:hypothetical protein
MKLDLGGTACYEDPGSVIISLDGTDAGDEVTPLLIADYNSSPFPDNTFDEALGSCYLEERPNWNELYRIMKPGAEIRIKSCDVLYASDEQVIEEILSAGFIIIETSAYIADYGYDAPWILRK